MRSRLLAILIIVLALALPRLPGHHANMMRSKSAMAASSASWGRHRRPPPWLKRPCQGRGCIDIAVLDSSGLCVVCNPSPHHPAVVTSALPNLTRAIWDNEAWQQAIT